MRLLKRAIMSSSRGAKRSAPASPPVANEGSCWGDALKDDAMRRYHDTQWGRPTRDEAVLFEFLSLEGAQAGLSWKLILDRRDAYRRAYHNWDVERVARMTAAETSALLNDDSGILRHKGKILSVVNNAKALLKLRASGVSFPDYVWGFLRRDNESRGHNDELPIIHDVALGSCIAQNDMSRTMAAQFKRDGFVYVGPTIMYSFMQAVGLVNDHRATCPVMAELRPLGRSGPLAGGGPPVPKQKKLKKAVAAAKRAKDDDEEEEEEEEEEEKEVPKKRAKPKAKGKTKK